MIPSRRTNQSGMALIVALIMLVILSALISGFSLTVMNSQNLDRKDLTKSQAFYSAHAGVEKLTADLGTLFTNNYAPNGLEIAALTANPPRIPATTYVSPQGGSGYEISFPADQSGNPTSTTRNIPAGPYQGLVGLITPYTMTATARVADGSEVRLRRTLQTAAIPVFQFGIFSEHDLSFFAGPAFNFGGRVHSNGNIFLASGSTLTMSDRVTAVAELIRTNLSNGWPTSNGYTGAINVLTSPGSYRSLAMNEGSLVGTLGSALNDPAWTTVSMSTYNGNIRNGRTGARRLELPLASFGAAPIDLIRRPSANNEDVANPAVFAQRYFSTASLRILLSDSPASITSLPTVTGTSPLLLGNLAVTPIGGYTIDSTHPPLAISSGAQSDGYRFPAGTPSLNGYIKIEMQNSSGSWQDVTLEVLNLGIAGRNLASNCADPNPNAIIRLERVKDNPLTNAPCGVGSTNAADYWPNVLYDAREAISRDVIPPNQPQILMGGVIHYIELDVNNLRRWLNGSIGANGAGAMNVTGYVVYFSDRRGNRNSSGNETAEYGYEDLVNPADRDGNPNGLLDAGEDTNSNGILDTYGQNAVMPTGVTGSAPYNSSATPLTTMHPSLARVNPGILFRRALKLVNGGLGNVPMPGLTVASENPVYIQGNYNATSSGYGDPHAACAVVADAVTVLSNSWNDLNSFQSPHNPSGRTASTTSYRFAAIAGKGLSFTRPSSYSTYQDFGTDGGMHNFLRQLENWGGSTMNYRGSMISLYTSHQATGIFKCCTTVYSPPSRNFSFDTEFLLPSLLPPRTPMFRDINVTGFTQLIMPNQ